MTIIQDMLAKYDYRNALKEIIQEVALCGMSHSGFFQIRAANSPQAEAMKLLDTLNQAFDKFTAEEALERYQGSIQ